MEKSIRIGAVNYLNTKPLICDLEELAPQAELVLDVPSRLADDLAAGRLDIGLIPVVEYFRSGKYSIIPNIAIGSNGPVLSVTLFSRVPWKRIRRLALDLGSRTSAALAQILLRVRHGVTPELTPLPLDQDAESLDTDAVLLIGDRAMRACLPGYAYAYDLGQEWTEWTGQPFVYAFWAIRKGVDVSEVVPALIEAKRRGLERIGPIAAAEATALGLDPGFCRRYLQSILRFDLGPREEEGLNHYYQLACQLGLARPGVNLEYFNCEDLVESY